MDAPFAIGALAALASTSSFIPQAVKIIRTRDTSGISAGMYVVTVIGFALWTSYGVLLSAWPLIVSNAISFTLSFFILTMKILPPPYKHDVADAIDFTSKS